MSNTNYDNRTVDLYILGDQDFKTNAPPSLINFTLGVEGDGSSVCTGLIKTMQKVVSLLLTYTMQYDPQWGTDFAGVLLRSSINKAGRYLETQFARFLADVMERLQAQETDFTQLDERLNSIELLELTTDINAGIIRARIRVSVATGESTEIVLPIPKMI